MVFVEAGRGGVLMFTFEYTYEKPVDYQPAGGFGFREMPPEVDQVNYLPHINVPTLMIHGELDAILPKDTATGMLDLLGTSPEHKHIRFFPDGHDVFPRGDMLKESNGWFDRYLGPSG